jgi:carbamate kinase
VAAVIDKDLTSALLAAHLHAEALIMLTGVERVALAFLGKLPRRDPLARSLRRMIMRSLRWRFDLTQPAEAASCRLCAP